MKLVLMKSAIIYSEIYCDQVSILFGTSILFLGLNFTMLPIKIQGSTCTHLTLISDKGVQDTCLGCLGQGSLRIRP